ncbi:hypothetical protein [Nonomuraea sp. NPDC003709]|uniref:P-loop ATPase, Sll1717 family n=1 Tax=Nonomuraea sp. NPDC003709 TaxID=3154450 RepID=UPI0033A23DAE
MDLVDVKNFGAVDADADGLWRDCFQDHPAYLSALGREKFLILGRKGSGKTAIFKKMITESRHDYFAYGHSFDDYPWQHHDLQAQVGVPEERRYIHSWKYLILISLAKVLLNNDSSQPWSDDALDAIGSIEDFVVDSYGSRDPDLRQLFSPEKELRFKGTLRLPFLHVQGDRVRVRELPVHIQEVNRAIQANILAALNPQNHYYVCFDELDLGFSPSDQSYADRLIGLIIAARDLNVAARDAGKRLNIVVFLRDDIYQNLRFEDKNKITENYSVHVRWIEDGKGLTLKQLMESRFAKTLGVEQGSVAWEDVFDEVREMPSRQTKYKHLCDRTFLRPRDMIKFCNEILVAHHDTGTSATKFENVAVHTAREEYSSYLLNELDDEISKHIPTYKEYLEVIKVVGTEKFSLNDFKVAWNNSSALKDVEPVSALAQLFEYSVVGYLKPGGRGGGSEYVWRYLDPRARFTESADTYRIHPGFKEALGLRTQSRS